MKYYYLFIFFIPIIICKLDKCCDTCSDKKQKYFSIPLTNDITCGESCFEPRHYFKYKLFKPSLKKALTSKPCIDNGFSEYIYTEIRGNGNNEIKIDIYLKK